MARRLSVWLDAWVPDWLYPIVLVGMLSMVLVAAVVAIGLVTALILVGRLIADTLIPSMKALVGVPTGVSPWIGLGEDSVVLAVPFGDLRTVQFGVDEGTRTAAVEAARVSVSAQLAVPALRARLDALLDGTQPPEERPQLNPAAPPDLVTPDRLSAFGAITIVAATAMTGALAWWGVNTEDAGEVGIIAAAAVAGVTVGGAAMLYLGGRAAERSSARSRFGVRRSERRSGTVGVVTMVAGLVVVAGGVAVSAWAMDERSADTTQATVLTGGLTSRQPGESAEVYTVRVAGRAEPLTLHSGRHLRLHERVFVEIDEAPGTATLVGALDDWKFAVSITMWILGIGLLVSAGRRRRWDTRCRRLAALTGDWQR